MNKPEPDSLPTLSPELPVAPAPETRSERLEASVAQLLHDFKNQLGGVKLYAAVLKKSLANNSLEVAEGIAICEKIIRQIDEMTVRTKAAARELSSTEKPS